LQRLKKLKRRPINQLEVEKKQHGKPVTRRKPDWQLGVNVTTI
jgi:hypothetical protein